MFRALLWKEWRQLRLLRWGGTALGVFLPIVLIAGAEVAKHGWLPTGEVKTYSMKDLLFELFPAMLALGVWPLVALLVTSQSFAGDRAAGTETFLLERPVPRGATWRARVVASLGSLLTAILLTSSLAGILARAVNPGTDGAWRKLALIGAAGLGAALLAYIGGMIAAVIVPSPFGAVLLGAILGAGPVIVAAQLMSFVYARNLGIVLPFLLPPGYVAASWLASCRGEPAGRGRLRRALTMLGSAFAAVTLLFVSLAPVYVRAAARSDHHVIFPSLNGRMAIVATVPDVGWGGGYLVDVSRGIRRNFIPPPVRDMSWSPDGSQFALLTWSGPFGSIRSNERIEVRSTEDGKLLRAIALPGDGVAMDIAWPDGGIVMLLSKAEAGGSADRRLKLLNPATGEWKPMDFSSKEWPGLVSAGPDRQVYVRELAHSDATPSPNIGAGFHLYPVDAKSGRVEPALADRSGNPLLFAGWSGGLSPSGRFARILHPGDDSKTVYLFDLQSGVESGCAAPSSARWVDGDRLVWTDRLGTVTRMFALTPGTAPIVLREWHDAHVEYEVSPDRRAVLVNAIPVLSPPAPAGSRVPDPALFSSVAPQGRVPEDQIYLIDQDRFVELGPAFSTRPDDFRTSQWAGPRTIARLAPGVVAFEDIDAPGKRRFAIGSASDLER